MSEHGKRTAKHRRQQIFLEAVFAGKTIMEACRQCDVPYQTYRDWRTKDKQFAAKVDSARAEQIQAFDTEAWTGDFVTFRKSYFGYDTYYHQQQIVNAIEQTPPGGVTLVLVPPEFGKTTLIEDYCNYRIGMNPNVRITVVSEGQPHARKILNRVKRRMTDTHVGGLYIARFGPFYEGRQESSGRPWAADFFTVLKADHDERDYTMEARGWRSAVAGTRTDLLIVDDIQSARSVTHTPKMLDTFRQDFLTRPGKEGRTVIIGTRVGIGDFYDEAILAGIIDEVVELPATDADGRSLCPEMWPDEALKKKRAQVGEEAWWRNYMQQPRQAGTLVFNDDMLEGAKDIGRRLGQVRHGIRKICGLDPALTGGCALVNVAYDQNHFEILDAQVDYNLGSTEAILSRVEAAAAIHAFQTLIVEGNAFQRGLVYDSRLHALSREYGFQVREHTTGRNKLDDDLGVARMPTSFIKGEVSIPYRDEPTQARMDHLIEQFANWRPHISGVKLRQDLVMATWFCWLDWQAIRQTAIQRSNTGKVRRAHMLPYQPTRLPGIGR